MYAFLRFPGFKKKAFTLSYDDGVIYDKRLIEIFNKNGLKATFNINSGNFGMGRRLPIDEAVELYKNSPHEVAVHGYKHRSLGEVNSVAALADVSIDRQNLEKTFGTIIRGMAYANGSFTEETLDILKRCGIVYSRTTRSTEGFDIPTNWLTLDPTCHHANPRLDELTEKFLDETPARHFYYEKPRLFYVWGHSYEFNDKDNWSLIENFAQKIGGHDNVWYATNIEIYDYVKAYESLIYSYDTELVTNPTATDVYACIYGKDVFIPAGKTVKIND